MIDDGSSSSSAKRIRVAKVLKPKTALDSRQLKRILIIIKEFKKVSSF